MNYGYLERPTQRTIKRFLRGDATQDELMMLDMRHIPVMLFVIVCSFLKHDKCVKELNFYALPLKRIQGKKVATMLMHNKTLQYVTFEVESNDLYQISAIFESVFETNTSLKGVNFLKTEWTRRNLERITRGLSKNRNLESLTFQARGMKDLPIFRMITTCGSNVMHLKFDGVNFGGDQALDIGKCLTDDTKLKTLSLSFCNLSQESCTYILSALLVNRTLTKLNLSNNKLKEEGGQIAARIIRENTVLEDLGLFNNKITDHACIDILLALRTNTTLTAIDMATNHTANTTWLFAADMMRINSTLTWFDASFQNISHDDDRQKSLQLAAYRNLSLYELIMREWDVDDIFKEETLNDADVTQPETTKRQRIN